MDSQNQIVNILLVEDDDVDQEAIQRAFRRQRIANPITVVSDGVHALSVLRGNDGYEPLPKPYIILLDINMPRMNGIEFLQQIRRDPRLESSIVFVLTTSDSDEDKLAAYDEQIAGYILKTRAGADFTHIISMLDSYWKIIEFPPIAN
jgi:CheY-like chemotaxis protein